MPMPGGYSVCDDVTKEDIKLFYDVMKNIMGVSYKPLAVAKQVVSGMNYCFICKYQIQTKGLPEGFSKIMIYEPLKGDPVIMSIEKIL